MVQPVFYAAIWIVTVWIALHMPVSTVPHRMELMEQVVSYVRTSSLIAIVVTSRDALVVFLQLN